MFAPFVGAAVVACSSSPEPSRVSFCELAKTEGESCGEPALCDETFAGPACASLSDIISPSTLSAAKDCLESGVCGAASCLSRAKKNAEPSEAHKKLAESFCRSCAPQVAGCESQFYSRGSKLPGLLLLPYADDVVAEVGAACTGTEGCQALFATCASELVAREVGARVEEAIASCVLAGFSGDDGESRGPGGGAQVATCTAANCTGCCREDRCEDGSTLDACGTGAVACQTCTGLQACTAGACKEPCGPDNCAGCCDGDTCLDGTANAACGSGGGACSPCAGKLICSKQKCIDGSCQATCINGCCSAAGCQTGNSAKACGKGGEACADCGVGRTCKSGACVLDTTSLWDVYISSGSVPSTNKSNSSWDVFGGAPDPYLKAFSSEGASVHSGQTQVKKDSTVPSWSETPLSGVKASELLSNFSIEIWDSDVDFDDFMGGCKVTLATSSFDGALRTASCAATSTGVAVKAFYRIKPHP